MAQAKTHPLWFEESVATLAYTPAEAARALGIHRRYIDAAIKAGELKRSRFGVKSILLTPDILDWVRNRSSKYAPEKEIEDGYEHTAEE